MNNLFSAVIFDLDGLVLDTESTFFAAWKKAAISMGFDFSDAFCYSFSGLSFQQLQQRLINECGRHFNLKQFNQLSSQFWREKVNDQGIPVKKGFLNLVAELKKQQIPFCLATNSPKNNALECLELAGLSQIFSIVISRDQVKEGKPAPEIFFAAAKALCIPIAQCMVLEDSSIGIEAAVSAGAISVLIPSIHPVQSSMVELADYFYTDLDQVVEIIKTSDFPAV